MYSPLPLTFCPGLTQARRKLSQSKTILDWVNP